MSTNRLGGSSESLANHQLKGRRGVCAGAGDAIKAWGGLAQGVSPRRGPVGQGDYWRLFSLTGFGRAASALGSLGAREPGCGIRAVGVQGWDVGSEQPGSSGALNKGCEQKR